MPKQKSLCLLCRSCMRLQRHVPAGKALPEITCKKGLYKDHTNPSIISCTEFDNINPGVTINAFPSKSQSGWADFLVQANGRVENELYSSFEDAMKAAASLLKQELSKHKKEVS